MAREAGAGPDPAQTHAAPRSRGGTPEPPAKRGLGRGLPHLRVYAQGSVALDEGFHDAAAGGRGRGHEHLVPLHGVQEGPEGPHHLQKGPRVRTRAGRGHRGAADAHSPCWLDRAGKGSCSGGAAAPPPLPPAAAPRPAHSQPACSYASSYRGAGGSSVTGLTPGPPPES